MADDTKPANGEQNFNDQELADIMNEIESLESELGDSGAQPAEAETEEVPEATQEPEASSPSSETPATSEGPSNVVPIQTTPSTGSTSTAIDFKVEGEMALNMNFHLEGQTFNLTVDKTGLSLSLPGGAQFKLPTQGGNAKKKAS
jgi:heme-binding NEAT domain protein